MKKSTYIRDYRTRRFVSYKRIIKKQHETFLRFHIRNKFFSRYLWFIKSFLLAKFGGLKFLNKK